MSEDHALFHFSVTCHTDNEAVMFCLRALCQYAEDHAKSNIGWGGTKRTDWEAAGHCITLRFTSVEGRQLFLDEANQLFGNQWSETETNDDNPATPQR